MNWMKIALSKQQTVFVSMHGIFPDSFTIVATHHEATGRSIGIPRLLRSHREFSTGWECTDISTQVSWLLWLLVVLVLLAVGKLVPGTCWLVGFSGIFVGLTSSGPWLSKAKNIAHRICYLVSSSIHRLLIKSFSSQKMLSFLVFPNTKNFLGCMIVFQSCEDKQDTSLENTGDNIFLTAKTDAQASPTLNEQWFSSGYQASDTDP